MKILQLALLIGHTNSEYNEFILPQSRQHEVTACTYFPPKINIQKGFDHYGSNATIKGYMRAIGKALEKGPYDIVHAHSPHVAVMFILYVIVNYLKYGSSIRKSVLTVHNSFVNYRLLHRIMLLIVFVLFKRIVFVSRSGRDSFPSVYHFIAKKKMVYIQNGFDIERINNVLGKQFKRDKSGMQEVISVGRLIRVKDPLINLKILNELNNNTFMTIIGDGYMKEELINISKKLNLKERVACKGLIPRDDVYRCLYDADVFVSTSNGEGLPVAVLEALACGCPAVLSDIPPHRELSEGADFIPLVEPGDYMNFAKKIRNILSLDDTEREKLSARCKKYVEGKFSMTRMLDQYENLYNKINE